MSESLWYKLIYYGLEFFGRYYSTYRGFVVDNNDPEGLNRIKVIYPGLIPNDKVGSWAFSKGQWGANNYGVQMLPQKGDMVLIEFDHGDLDYPIWSHAGYGEKEKPEEFKNTDVYGFKTPQGNIITIDDSGQILVKYKTGKEYIIIEENLLKLESKIIQLGDKGEYKAVKGETNNDKLQAICEKLNSLIEIFVSHSHPGDGAPASNIAQATSLGQEIQTLIQVLPETLSDKVKLD